MLAFWAIGDHHPPHSERESSTYVVRSNEKAPLHVRESAYTKSLWAYVWRMDRHRSESNERQSGVCTKSARRRFRTQDLRFVERYNPPLSQGSRGRWLWVGPIKSISTIVRYTSTIVIFGHD